MTMSKYTFVDATLAVGVLESTGLMASTEDLISASGRWPSASKDGTHSIVGWMNRELPVVPRNTCTASVMPTSALPYRESEAEETSMRLYSGLYCSRVCSHVVAESKGSVVVDPAWKVERSPIISMILTASSVRRMQSPLASP